MIRRLKVLAGPESVLAIGRTKKSLRRDLLWLTLALALAAACLAVEAGELLRDARPDYLSLGAVGLGLGVLALLGAQRLRLRHQLRQRDRVVFDRAQAQVRHADGAAFCSFAEVQGVVLEAVHDAEDHFCGYRLYVTAQPAGQLLIGEGLDAPKDLALAHRLADFLGKPLHFLTPTPTISHPF